MNEQASADRRSDRERERLVERAVMLQGTTGPAAAAALLAQAGIAQHIALRVLACAAFRRKRSEPQDCRA